MNQILSTNGPKQVQANQLEDFQKQKEKFEQQKVKPKKELSSEAIQALGIIKSFAIFLLIFGVLNVIFASYIIAKDIKEKKLGPEVPSISVSDLSITGKTTNIIVKSRYLIDSVTYSWDTGAIQTIPTSNLPNLYQQIVVPNGTHILHVNITNKEGYSASQSFEIVRDGDIKIDAKENDSQIQVDIDSKVPLESVSYRWNNEDDTAQEVNGLKYSFNVNVPVGTNELTITARGKNSDIYEEYKTSVTGKTDVQDEGKGPDVWLSSTNTDFVIEGQSDNGIRLVEYFVTNSNFPKEDYPDGKAYKETVNSATSYQQVFKLVNGYNKLTIRMFDVNNNVTIKTIEKTLELDNE